MGKMDGKVALITGGGRNIGRAVALSLAGVGAVPVVMYHADEGAAILAEGIAARPGDVDIVYLNGYGFPKWRGGPMFHADSLGLETVIGKLQALRELTGDPCWEPAPLLLQLAGEGRTLASLKL